MKFTLLGIFEKGNHSIIQFDDMKNGVSLSNSSNFLLLLKNEQTILCSVGIFCVLYGYKLKVSIRNDKNHKITGKSLTIPESIAGNIHYCTLCPIFNQVQNKKTEVTKLRQIVFCNFQMIDLYTNNFWANLTHKLLQWSGCHFANISLCQEITVVCQIEAKHSADDDFSLAAVNECRYFLPQILHISNQTEKMKKCLSSQSLGVQIRYEQKEEIEQSNYLCLR